MIWGRGENLRGNVLGIWSQLNQRLNVLSDFKGNENQGCNTPNFYGASSFVPRSYE